MATMLWLFAVEIGLNVDWYEMEQATEELNFHNTLESAEMENRIFRIDMLLATLGFINFVIVFFYVFNHHQDLIDRWRRIRGKKSKPFLAISKDKASKFK